jgi:crotonobetainyl-CoA:carnitine CoA-transferase CaiB-like acyl-CoA transferase
VLIGANSDPLFARLVKLIGEPELLDNPAYAGNRSRVQHAAELDEIIGAWSRQHTIDELLAMLDAADMPNSKAYTAADCAADPQYRARGMVREFADPAFDSRVLHTGVVPHVPESPGDVRWPGPAVAALCCVRWAVEGSPAPRRSVRASSPRRHR